MMISSKMQMVSVIVALLTLCGQATLADEKEITYSQGEGATTWGTNYGKAETYDVAMHIADPALAGMKIHQLRIPFSIVKYVSEVQAWLSKDLPAIKSGKMTEADIVTVPLTPAPGYTTVTLPEPYTLTEEGVYVGYSFKMDKPNDDTAKPVVTTMYTSQGGLLVHTTGKYRTAFHDLYPYIGQLAVEVVLSGSQVKDRAVSVAYLPELNARAGEATFGTFEVMNHGAAGAAKLDYTVEVAGQTVSRQAEVSLRKVYGDVASVDFELPAISDRGGYDYRLTIDRVDGEPNEDAETSAQGRVNVYSDLPRHRAVLEEYTGTWCGYCPRGFVGLEEMNRLYPDDFIGISYHNGDPMEITRQFPSDVQGFPDAWIDRTVQTDAFCGGEAYGTFGIDKVWERRCQVFAPASIDMETTWIDDDHLQATAHVTFPVEQDDCPWEIGFALLHDGMTGTESGWTQSNYYNGETGWPASMDAFTLGKSKVQGLVFNDVIVARSGIAGIGGSLQAPIVADVAQTCTYTFDMAEVLNTSKQSLIQDKGKLRVVAMLIDTRNGTIANANKCDAGLHTGIDRTMADRDATVVNAVYHNMQGQRIDRRQRGVAIRTERLANGKTRHRKVRM